MPEKDYSNPFQTSDLYIPVEFKKSFAQFCQTRSDGTRSTVDLSPFPRMVDLWFTAFSVAVRLNLSPVSLEKKKTYKAIEGQVFSSDPWRIQAIMLAVIGMTNDVEIVREPRKVLALANGLAIAGLPRVIEMLEENEAGPIWDLSDGIERMIRKDQIS